MQSTMRREMGAGIFVRLLACCLVVATASAQTAGAEWETPKFIQPPTATNSTLVDNPESAGGIIVYLNEHSTPIIALINYAGTTMPESSAETDLKIAYAWSKEDGMYTMQVTASLDYEIVGKGQYFWNVQIDGEENSVFVNLVNINDNPPQFINQERSCRVEEFVGDTGSFVEVETNCLITVRDADGDIDKNVVLSVFENGEEAAAFKVVRKESPNADKTEQEYVLKVVQPLDYEEYAVHVLKIRADDGVHEEEISYVVDVIDLPDQPPVWDKYLGSLNIDEKQNIEVFVSAHDGDLALEKPVVIAYKLKVQQIEYEEYFEIGETDGKLTIKPIDRDTLQQETFVVTLTAYETTDEASFAEQDVIVIVNDVNDHSPTITAISQETAVNESYSGTFDFEIIIEDPDLADNGRFSIELEESEWKSAFLVVPGSGYQSSNVTISVLDPTSLDYEKENWKTITLKIITTEVANASHVDSMEFTINLIDVNDESPVFTEDTFTATLPENEPIDTLVATISATDKDAGDVIKEMGAGVVVRPLACCLVAATASAQTAGAVWETPKFIQPPTATNSTISENTESPGGIIVELNEHSTPIIALINYAGTTMPKSSVETDLKIVYAWSEEDGMYTMEVTASLDYEIVGKGQYFWNVQIDDEEHSVFVNLVNINDNL